MTINIPGIDAQKGLDLYDGDTEIYFTVLHSWVNNTPAALNRLRNVSAATLSDYAITVHGVKGTSTTIGAEEIRKTAMKLESLANAGDLSGVLAQNEAFIKSTEDLVNIVQNWLNEQGV